MIHVRCTHVEFEMEDTQGLPAVLMTALFKSPAPPIAPAQTTFALPAAASRKPVSRRPSSRGAASTLEAHPTSFLDAVREAIADGPKSNQGIREYCEKKGFAKDSNTVSQALWALRKQTEIYKGGDLKWYVVAQKGTR